MRLGVTPRTRGGSICTTSGMMNVGGLPPMSTVPTVRVQTGDDLGFRVPFLTSSGHLLLRSSPRKEGFLPGTDMGVTDMPGSSKVPWRI